MRPEASSVISEGVVATALVLLLLLPLNFAMSNDVITTDSDDCHESSESIKQGNMRTNNNGRRCNGSGQLEANNTNDADAFLKQLQERHIRITRDRELRMFLLMIRFLDFRYGSTSSSPSGVGTYINPRDATDLQGFESLLESEHNRNYRDDDDDDSESTTHIYASQCSGPRNFTGTWNDGTHFRLYFKVEPTGGSHRLRETVSSAFLYIKMKSSLGAGGHRPALTSGRAGRQRSAGAVPGSGSGGRTSHQRRRPSRETGDTVTASSSSSSFSSSRLEVGGGSLNNLKIIVHSFSRSGKKNRQDMRTVSISVVSPQPNEWIRLNLTQVVDDWMRRPARNLGLQVTLRTDGSSSAADLDPAEYFEGTSCSATTEQSSPLQLPQPWSLEEPISQTIIDWTRTHLDNITHPFLEVATVEVPRSRPRHRRDLKAGSLYDHGIENPSRDTHYSKSSMIRRWLQSIKDSEGHLSFGKSKRAVSNSADSAIARQ